MLLVLVAAALFVYLQLRSDLDESIDGGLRSRADDVAAFVGQGDPDLGGAASDRLAESDESFAQVLSPSGRLVAASAGSAAAALAPTDVRRASQEAVLVERQVPGIEGTARILARPAAGPGGDAVVVVGASLEDRDEALTGLLASFAIGGPIAVLLASGIGYLLAAAGLAPIEAMRIRASQVSLGHGGDRLPLPGADDEVRRLGETLNEMLTRLEASFERERRFVADASHELRTPLAVLKTELETTLRRAEPGTELRRSLATALEEADGLIQLADDLLLIARAAEGELPVRREAVEVRELLARTRDRFADRAAEQGRAIEVNAPAGLTALVDPLRIRQALGNLVDNALRHGAGRVLLQAREAKDALEIDVSDQGAGFAAAVAPQAFERFARGEGPRTPGGAGLGLAIVRVIAAAHGGTAAIVESGAGATVRLSLPRSPARS